MPDPIDYAALAEQAKSQPAAPPDYAALADTARQQAAPDNWTTRYPKTATAARGVLSTLPAVGAMTGGVLAAPAAAATLNPLTGAAIDAAGVGLGAGAGRGLRDLIAEGLGLESVSTPGAKAGRIALDTAEGAAAQAILPGLLEAMKTPGRTVGEAVTQFKNTLPQWAQKFLPSVSDEIANRPAQILVRPAWQTWQDHVPNLEAGTNATIDRYMPNVSGYVRPIAPEEPGRIPLPNLAKMTPADLKELNTFMAKPTPAYDQSLVDRAIPTVTAAEPRAFTYEGSGPHYQNPPPGPAIGGPLPAGRPLPMSPLTLVRAAPQGMKLTAPEVSQGMQWLAEGVKPDVILQRILSSRQMTNRFGLGR